MFNLQWNSNIAACISQATIIVNTGINKDDLRAFHLLMAAGPQRKDCSVTHLSKLSHMEASLMILKIALGIQRKKEKTP